MGICQSPTENKRKSKEIQIVLQKLQEKSSINSAKTACSLNNSNTDERMLSFKCSVKNDDYTVPFSDFEKENIVYLPCRCIRRKDVSLENFIKEYEDLHPLQYKSMCRRHKIQFVFYCFECELKICSKCNLASHEKFYKDHHLFCINGKMM